MSEPAEGEQRLRLGYASIGFACARVARFVHTHPRRSPAGRLEQSAGVTDRAVGIAELSNEGRSCSQRVGEGTQQGVVPAFPAALSGSRRAREDVEDRNPSQKAMIRSIHCPLHRYAIGERSRRSAGCRSGGAYGGVAELHGWSGRLDVTVARAPRAPAGRMLVARGWKTTLTHTR
jgi:hypothetical protein